MQEKKHIEIDELIIGSGLSGLSYGITAAKDGRKVMICEAQSKVGGYASNFYRNKRKYVFDCSQHYITGMKEDGNLNYILDQFGILPFLNIQFRQEMLTIVYKKEFIPIASQGTEFRTTLINYFPVEEKGIRKLFDDINYFGSRHCKLYKTLITKVKLDGSLFSDSRMLENITAKQYYQTLFKNDDLIEIICSTTYAIGAIPEEENAYRIIIMLYYAFFTGTGYIKGKDNKTLSEIMANQFKNLGGQILLNNPVISLDIKSDKKWVTVYSKKRIIKAKSVVSACSPHNLLNMIGKNNLDAQFVKKVEKLEPNGGTFCVYTVSDISPEEVGIRSFQYTIINDQANYYSSKDNESRNFDEDLPILINNYHNVAKERGYILQFSLFNDNNEWFEYSEEKYKLKKEEIQNKILDRVYKVFPKLKGRLIYIESSTPRTNHKYTLSTNGSAFGFKMSPNTSVEYLVTTFPDKRIKICGSWACSVGYEPTVSIGYITAKLYTQQLMKERLLKGLINMPK